MGQLCLHGDDQSAPFRSVLPDLLTPLGGEPTSPATYWTNPQFKIHLDEVDDHQEEGIAEACCTVLLGLMQKNRRRQKRMGQGLLSIGYAVYQVLRSRRHPFLHT